MARINAKPVSAGSSLRKVHVSAEAAWRQKRAAQVRAAVSWAVPLVVVAGLLAGVATRRVYFGVAFAVLLSAALADIARCRPGSVRLAGHRASGEAATARALKPLRYQGFTALHDRRLPPNTAPGLPPVDIEHLLIGPAGVFLLDSKNWMSGPKAQFLGDEIWVGREQRTDALKRLAGDARNLTDALRPRLPQGLKVEPVMVVHVKDIGKPLPRVIEGVTMLLPDQFATVFGGMWQRMTATEATSLAASLDTVLAPKTGDRLAPG